MYRSLAQGGSSAMLDDGYDDGYDDVPVYRSIVGVGCLEVATHAVVDHALEEDMSCRGYAGYGHAGSWGQLGSSGPRRRTPRRTARRRSAPSGPRST